MSKQSKTWLSFPKVIAVVAVFCSFVLVKFQTPVTPKVPHKRHAKRVAPKLKAATLETQKVDIDLKKNETLSQAEVNPVSQGPSIGLSRCHRVFEGLGKYQANLSAAHQEDKKELKLSRVNSKQALATKTNKAQSLKKKTEKQLKLSKRIVLPQWIIDDIENPELNSQDGLDNPSPLDELAKSSFLENSLSDNFDPNPLVALVQIRSLLDSDFEFETERPLMVRESLFQKISFADLEESLQNIKKSEVKRVSDIQSPKAKMAWAKITDIPKVAQLRDIQNNFEIEKPKTDSVLEEISDSQISKLAPEVERTQNEAESKQQEKRQADQELGQPMAGGLKLESPPKLELRPKLASVGDDLENTFEKTVQLAKSKILNTQVNTVEPVSESRGVNNQKDPSEEDSSDHSSGGVFYGELQVDDSAINWLNSQKGHIELFLNRVGSKDPQDTVFLMDYQFPGSGNQFEFDGTGMKGKYRLVAGVYTPASAVPVAQVMYSKVISSENYKEKIKFEVSHTAISTAPGRSESQRLSETVPLNVTLFDGAPGSYRSPKTLKAGEVTVVGYPELGRFPVDKEGNIRIPSVPVASELLVEARAPGYYPTRQIVPIFSTAAYAPLYLIQKDKVEVVTQFFTKKPQQAEKSVVMGRVYDIKSRSPLAGETLSLSHRKGSAVYFGALPDINQKTTLDTGLFGFYNVEPSIRSIARSIDKHSLLLTLLPDYGYFVELGRGGSRDLVGSLTDPFLRKPVFGSLQLVGDSKEAEATESNGKFKLEGLDLPPGVITLEAQAEGYPTTWFTVPWSVRDSIKENYFYMMERDLIKESASRIARVRHEKNTGVIVGGAHSSMFNKSRKQLKLELFDMKGLPVSNEHGPFSLSQIPKSNAAYALTATDPGFAFFNLAPGEYLLKMKDENGKAFRSHIVRVGVERVSVVVN